MLWVSLALAQSGCAPENRPVSWASLAVPDAPEVSEKRLAARRQDIAFPHVHVDMDGRASAPFPAGPFLLTVAPDTRGDELLALYEEMVLAGSQPVVGVPTKRRSEALAGCPATEGPWIARVPLPLDPFTEFPTPAWDDATWGVLLRRTALPTWLVPASRRGAITGYSDVLHRVKPINPEAARGQRPAQCVAVVHIGPDGAPTDVEVSRCPEVFHASTVEALLQWRWLPPAGPAGAITKIAVRYP